MKHELVLVGLLVVWVGCSKKNNEAETADGANGAAPALSDQPWRSFDPALSEPEPVISALDIVKNTGAAPAASTIVKGRETSLAQEIMELPEGDARNLAMVQLFSQWAMTDIDAAMDFGWTLKDDQAMKRAFLQGVAPYLSEHRPERLLDIIAAGNWWPNQWMPEHAALRRVAKVDFERATEFFANTTPPKQHRAMAYQFARQIAATESTEAAFEYAERLSNPKGKPGAVRAAVSHWMEEDSVAASTYARDVEDPLVRDHAVLGVVDGLWQSNPDDTVTWAASISDDELRASTYTRLARSWTRHGDTESVEAMLNSPEMSQAERGSVREALAEDAAAAE